MPIQIGKKPDHGFDEPLGLLSDCHRRIEHFLRVLVAVTRGAAGGPLTPEYRAALEGSLKYFATSGPKHTEDEEVSLFPRMKSTSDPRMAEALTAIESLQQEHEEAEERHAAVHELGTRWLENDGLSQEDARRLREHMDRLESLYERHIRVEDQEVFPAAARALDPAQIQEIGGEMAARRAVAFKAPVTREV
jgi:hemerythrin-like domain-containing protein